MLKNEATRRKTISVKQCWRKIRALKISSSSSRASKSLIRPTESGPQKCYIFVLDVSLVLLLPVPVSASDFGDIWVTLTPEHAAWKCQGWVIVQGMTPWHIWDQILSVWLGKSLWVTSRGERCLQLPDPPTRQDPGAPASVRAGNTFWQTELNYPLASAVSPSCKSSFFQFLTFYCNYFFPPQRPPKSFSSFSPAQGLPFPKPGGEEAALADAVSWFTKALWQQQLPTLLIQRILILGLPLHFSSWLLLKPSLLNKKRLYICDSYMQLSYRAKQTKKCCRHTHVLMQLRLLAGEIGKIKPFWRGCSREKKSPESEVTLFRYSSKLKPHFLSVLFSLILKLQSKPSGLNGISVWTKSSLNGNKKFFPPHPSCQIGSLKLQYRGALQIYKTFWLEVIRTNNHSEGRR